LNALTKVFVVLLVICSIVLTASVVTFVQRVEDYRLASEGSQKALAEANRKLNEATTEAAAQRAAFESAATRTAAQIEAKNADIASLQKQIVEQSLQLANAQTANQTQGLAITQLTEGLKAAQDMASRQSEIITALRNNADTLLRQNTELSSTVNDLTNRLEVTTRDMRFFQEQLADAQAQAARFQAVLRQNGIDPSAGNNAQVAANVPRINGVIDEVRNIGGVTYATISVGSADSVSKGMQFNVVDVRGNGGFLGILTVDSVEAQSATGRLTGPRVEEIQPGHEVRTQL
jgi:chromosome segregation ATPase